MVAKLALMMLVVGGGLAQTPPPTLSRTTQMTIQALATELQQVQKDFTAADELVKKEFPGYHLNGQTLQVEKDVVAPTKPEGKK